MLERFRKHKEITLGSSFVLIGSPLLLLAIPFVTAWVQILSLAQSPGHPPTICGPTQNGLQCWFTVTLWAPPSPYLLFAAYGIALPAALVLSWWILRGRPGGALRTDRYRSWSRVGAFLPLGALGWVGGFIVAGFVLDWLSIPILPWYRYLFLASILVAPVIVLGVGAAYFGWEIRDRLSERSRASRG